MKEKTHDKSEGLGLFSIVWIGFNFIAGITCATAFKRIVWDGNAGVGLHLLWIDVIEGAIAFACAWSFAKLVRVHPNANGGLSQYARTSFGKFWGLVGGLLNYMSLPLIASTMFVSAIRTNFDAGSSVNLVERWGSYAHLYLDLMGLAVFAAASILVFFGTKKYKYFSNIIGILTWTLTLVVIAFGIGAFIMNKGSSISFLAKHAPISSVDGKSFANTFLTIFFSFAGLETFITSGQTIKDRAKNMPIGIALIMLFVTIFYVIFTFIVMGACVYENGDGFGGNPSITLFHTWDLHLLSDGAKTFQALGSWLVIITTILMRFNSLLNITMFGGLTIEPLAKQGFISDKISKQSEKSGLPNRALILTIVIYWITAALFLIVPDIIEGATKSPSPFDYSMLASVSSIILIAIYVLSIVSCLKNGFAKKMQLHIIEYIVFFGVLVFQGFLLVMYLWTSIVDPLVAGGAQNIVGAIIQIIYMLAIVAVALGLYFGYHKKFLREIANDPERQKALAEYETVFTIVAPADGGIFSRKSKEIPIKQEKL